MGIDSNQSQSQSQEMVADLNPKLLDFIFPNQISQNPDEKLASFHQITHQDIARFGIQNEKTLIFFFRSPEGKSLLKLFQEQIRELESIESQIIIQTRLQELLELHLLYAEELFKDQEEHFNLLQQIAIINDEISAWLEESKKNTAKLEEEKHHEEIIRYIEVLSTEIAKLNETIEEDLDYIERKLKHIEALDIELEKLDKEEDEIIVQKSRLEALHIAQIDFYESIKKMAHYTSSHVSGLGLFKSPTANHTAATPDHIHTTKDHIDTKEKYKTYFSARIAAGLAPPPPIEQISNKQMWYTKEGIETQKADEAYYQMSNRRRLILKEGIFYLFVNVSDHSPVNFDQLDDMTRETARLAFIAEEDLITNEALVAKEKIEVKHQEITEGRRRTLTEQNCAIEAIDSSITAIRTVFVRKESSEVLSKNLQQELQQELPEELQNETRPRAPSVRDRVDAIEKNVIQTRDRRASYNITRARRADSSLAMISEEPSSEEDGLRNISKEK